MLTSLPEEAEIMNLIAGDRSIDIRCSALRSLNRLQDYTNPEDKVIRIYCITMQMDETFIMKVRYVI